MNRKIKLVDRPLYEYIKTEKKPDLDQAKLYSSTVLGYTSNQFVISLKRLIDLKLVKRDGATLIPKHKVKHPPMVIYPCLDDDFIDVWLRYIDYRIKAKKPYASVHSEQLQLNFYWKESGRNPKLFIAGVEHTMNKTWLGCDYGIKKVRDSLTQQDERAGNASPAAYKADEYLSEEG